MSEQEWQPARYRKVHERPSDLDSISTMSSSEAHGKIIHVKPTDNAPVWKWRSFGCDAEKFYQVREYENTGVCEHEILTD